jgi:uncharacterized membrane protein
MIANLFFIEFFAMNVSKELRLPTNYRIESIDILRGIVMVIMALDHVREFFHHDSIMGHNPLDLNTTWPVLFATRWITHYCAPVFVFLSGTSVFLYSQRGRTKKHIAFFLFTRGLWLMLAEISIVNLLWEFNNAGSFLVLQVIWAIGLSMVVLSVLQFLPYKILLAIGLVIVLGQYLLDGIKVEQPLCASIGWSIVHVLHPYQVTNHFTLFVAYPFLAWLGLMILGYCLGKLYTKGTDAARRKKFLFTAGISALCLFVVIRFINFYGDMHQWSPQKTALFTFFDFISTTKYPPSLLYMLMTIGPALIILSFTENISNWFTRLIMVYGKVPFFYYLLHVFLIHSLAWIFFFATGRGSGNVVFMGKTPVQPDAGYPLWEVYIIWISVIIILYFPCKWYSRYKASHPQNKWLSYL